MEQFHEETDRAAAVLAGGYLEQLIRHALRKKMVPDKSVEDLFDARSGPLGSFAARVDLAFALGLVDAQDKRDLDLIRKIRNEFAHEADARFEGPPVSQWCSALSGANAPETALSKALRGKKKGRPLTNRRLYLLHVAIVADTFGGFDDAERD